MNIYFVSQQSRIKGPSDITDARRRRIISIGDFCVREIESGTELLWVVQKNATSWHACSRVAFTSAQIACESNSLLFAYDGTSLRRGRIELLQRLTSIFEGNAHDFFQNAINILTYQSDCWNMQVFQVFHKGVTLEAAPSHEFQSQTNVPSMQLLFLNYLAEPLKAEFIDSVSQGKKYRQAYADIRANHSEAFYKALSQFLRDYPNHTIYDVISNH